MPIVDLDNINADDAKDTKAGPGGSFLKPAGFYRMRLTEIKDMTKPGKQAYFGTTFVYPDNEDQWVFGGWSFHPAYIANYKRDLIRMGVPADQLGANYNSDDVHPQLIGWEGMVYIDIEDDYRGRTDKDGKVIQNNVVVYIADPSGNGVSGGAKSSDFDWDKQ